VTIFLIDNRTSSQNTAIFMLMNHRAKIWLSYRI